MIPHKLTFRGLTRFRQTVSIDFDTFPRGLTAVAGPNGAGKTTILEAIIVAIYGVFPTRPGSVYEYLNPPLPGEVPREVGESGRTRKPADALIDLSVTLDDTLWRFRRRFDVKARSQSCQVWIDGTPANEGKTEEAAHLVAKHWPPLSQVLASVFAAQGGQGSFLSLKPAQRKDLIVTMLGLERLQDLAAAALADASACSSVRDRAAEAVERAEASHERLQEARDTLTAARRQSAAAAEQSTEADRAARECREALDAACVTCTAATAADVAAKGKASETEEAAASTRNALESAAASLQSASASADRIDAVREQAAAVPALREEYERLVRVSNEADAVVQGAAEFHRGAVAEAYAAEHDCERLQQEIARIGPHDVEAARVAVVAELAAIEAAGVAAETAATLRTRCSQLQKSAEQERAGRVALSGAEGRAGLLGNVPCRGGVVLVQETEADCATCPLLADAKQAERSIPALRDDLEFVDGAGSDLTAAHAELATANRAHREAQDAANRSRGAEARLQSAIGSAGRLAELRVTLAANEAGWTVAKEAVAAASARLDELRAALPDVPTNASLKAAERAALDLVSLAEDAARVESCRVAVDVARGACDEAEASHAAAREESTACRAVAAEAVAAVDAATPPHTAAARLAASLTTTLKAASAAQSKAVGAVEALEEADGVLTEARSRLVVADQEYEDAALLATVLGRDGVQAMELDAVGPAVSSIATEILRVVYGPRFSVQLITQVLKRGAAGKRGETKEVFDVRVIDDVRGTDGPASRLSGGERVVVSESLKLALAVFASQSGASKLRTLVRDESDGALDDERAHLYPAMLRRAQELGGFELVLLVSHRPSNVAACDAVLRVADGGAVLEIA